MGGGEVRVKKPGLCGYQGKVCAPVEYPTCDKQLEGGERFIDLRRIQVAKEDGYIVLTKKGDDPVDEVREPNLGEKKGDRNEIDAIVSSTFLTKEGMKGVCMQDARWFAYRDRVGAAHVLTYMNEAEAGGTRSAVGELGLALRSPVAFELSASEMVALYAPLKLSPAEVSCQPNHCPKYGENPATSMGRYFFPSNGARLGEMVKILEKGPIDGIKDDRRLKLAEHLTELKHTYDTQVGNMALQRFALITGVPMGAVQLVFGVLMYFMFKKSMKTQQELMELNMKMMKGDKDLYDIKNYSIDLVEQQRKLLAADIVENEIRGFDEEALEILRRYAQRDTANPLVVGPSGGGKDAAFERAAQLIALHDPRVPKQFYDGTIKGILHIKGTELAAGPGIVGSAAARNATLIRAWEEGWAEYTSELPRFLSAGSSNKGEAESLASALIEGLERRDPDVQPPRFGGTTTQEALDALVLEVPQLKDLKRRLPPLVVKEPPINALRDAIFTTLVYREEKNYKGVVVTPEAKEAILNLALLNMDAGDHARVNAVKGLLRASIELAQVERGQNGAFVTITPEDVSAALFKKTGKPMDADAKFKETLRPKDLSKEVSYGERWMAMLEKDAWFKGLTRMEKCEALSVVVRRMMERPAAEKGKGAPQTAAVSDAKGNILLQPAIELAKGEMKKRHLDRIVVVLEGLSLQFAERDRAAQMKTAESIFARSEYRDHLQPDGRPAPSVVELVPEIAAEARIAAEGGLVEAFGRMRAGAEEAAPERDAQVERLVRMLLPKYQGEFDVTELREIVERWKGDEPDAFKRFFEGDRAQQVEVVRRLTEVVGDAQTAKAVEAARGSKGKRDAEEKGKPLGPEGVVPGKGGVR